MLDISDIERHLAGLMERHYRQRAAAGLRAKAAEDQGAMRATTAYDDDSGATREGTVAYVVGEGVDAGALATAVAAVEARNPGESATASGVLPGDLGVVYTVPTSYQRYLETMKAGEHAFLGPTLAANADDLTRRAAEGR